MSFETSFELDSDPIIVDAVYWFGMNEMALVEGHAG